MDKVGRLHLTDQGIDNMTDLVELSDQSLLSNLQIRYSQKLIYTYIGSILISINPYTELGIYETKNIQSYQNKSMQDMPPHLFGIGEINYSKAMMENENQVIVISGESGAGKTESFKRLLKYFAYVSGGFKESKHSSEMSNDIATKILDSTPLLESFGNAQTIRNDNSSRFGKYVEIFFENGNICGSKITNYLLEKSRIVNINPSERGYHIFYEVLQGFDSYSKSQYYFKNIQDYDYLNQSKNFFIKDRNDANNLTEFMNQWSSLGLSAEEMDVTMRILSGVLHLGNVKFMEEQEISYLAETENIGIVAKVLKVDQDSLKHCLTMKTTETVKDASSSPLNVEQSINYRDTLAKHLYSELFNWIVGKVNESLNQNNLQLKQFASVVDQSLAPQNPNVRCIAMLDIYGFENFPENSLEQLCINYANETLQQFFNKYVFELEQAEYKQEGIDWHYISYPDNQPIIDLLSSKPNGIIQILNDECSIPQGSDTSFLTKCHNVHSKNTNYEKPKKVHPPQFIIHHFAGNISYNVTGFLEKNRDVLRKEILTLIEHSEIEELSLIFRRKRELQAKNPVAKARTPAVMGDFQNSLITLLTKMKASQPWFIRCLKPNGTKEALKFNKDIVMDQMKYTGILETVKIRKSGFPIRILFSVFLSRFYLLVTKDIRRASKQDQQEACLKLMLKFKGEKKKHFEIGKTKLFLKETFARHLEKQVQIIRNRSAIIIQRNWRAYWKIKQIIIQNNAATKIQAAVRGFLDRRRVKKFRKGMIQLQSLVRMQLVRKKFLLEHPNFLKYVNTKRSPEKDTTDSSKLTTYKMPKIKNQKKDKKIKKNKSLNQFNYDLLKIPIELAHILDKITGDYGTGHAVPPPECVVQTGRAQHLWNRGEYKLPDNIDSYVIENLLDEYYNNVPFESKLRPINNPFLKQNDNPDYKENALISHKLVLRILNAKEMPWIHRYLTICYLLLMGMKSLDICREIFVQILAEALPKKNKNRYDSEDERLVKAWTLLGDFLSFIIPTPDIYDFILKCVSDCVGVDQAVTCQEKLLQFAATGSPPIPRLYPITNLEHRANHKGAKTCVNVVHPDENSNSIHLNSFTTSENLASHSLCFRVKKYKLLKGWSISVVFDDRIYDCGGHNYVYDVIASTELPQYWSEITGRVIESNFLTSRRRYVKGDNSDMVPRGLLKNVGKTKDSPASNKNTSSSLHSLDNWVDGVFSYSQDDQSSIPVQNFIHGVEDEIRARRQGQFSHQGGSASELGSNPSIVMHDNLNNSGFEYQTFLNPASSAPNLFFPGPSNELQMLQDPTYLEEQLQTVELENKVIKSTIEREMLQSRLQKIQQHKQFQKSHLTPNVTGMQYQQPIPQYSYGVPLSNPYIPYNQFGLPLFNPQLSNNQFYGNQMMSENRFMSPHNPMQNYQMNQSFVSQQNSHLNPNFKPVPKVKIVRAYQASEYGESEYQNEDNTSNNFPATPKKPQAPQPPVLSASQEPPASMNPPVSTAPTAPAAPPVPPAPPPPQLMINKEATTKMKEENNMRNKNPSIVKYSEIGEPSDTVVDDSTILPTIVIEEKKSYQRAAEVPKVNVNSRAAFLENFFKDKPFGGENVPQFGKKRKAPQPPVVEIELPESQANAIDLLTSMNKGPKLIPRPSIKSKEPQNRLTKHQIENQLPRMSIDDSVDGNKFQPLNTSSKVIFDNYKILKPPPKKGKYISNNKAIILCGLPDMKYYTYQKTPWFLLLKREIYLPNEVQSTTMLNPLIFCQIVKDLIEFPCIRWMGNEKQRLLSMLGRNINKNINSIISAPSELMLQIINEAQKCELYFSRFYSIQWVTSTEVMGVSHWMAVSHTGIRFVQQNFRSLENQLIIRDQVIFPHIIQIFCDEPDVYNNPQILIIETKSGKMFKMRTIHAASIQLLIQEFLSQIEITKSHGTINLASSGNVYVEKPKKKRNLLKENSPFTDSETMTLGVNNQRIAFKKPVHVPESSKPNAYSIVSKQGNLIDFVSQYSKHKDTKFIEHVILRCQQEPLSEPILPYLNIEMAQRCLDINRLLLQMVRDSSYGKNSNLVEHTTIIFKSLLRTKEINEETFLQIFKQINGLPDTNGRKHLWNLLSFIIIFIGPTKRMEAYLIEHLNQICKSHDNQDQHLASFALKNCNIFKKSGPRKECLLEDDIVPIMEGNREKQIQVKVSNEMISINAPFNILVEEVIKMICEKMNVNTKIEHIEYSIAYVGTNNKNNNPTYSINYLDANTYLFDSIIVLKKQMPNPYSLYFTRMSWVAPLSLENRSSNFISFTFNLISKSILNGDWLIPSNDPSSKSNDLSNLSQIAYFNLRGQGITKIKNEDILKMVLPPKLLDQKKKTISKKDIMKKIAVELGKSTKASTPDVLNFQKKFLEEVEKLPRYGCIKFPVTLPQGSGKSVRSFINFDCSKIFFTEEESHEEIVSFWLTELISFNKSNESTKTSMFSVKYKQNDEVQFYATDVPEITIMLNLYLSIKNLRYAADHATYK